MNEAVGDETDETPKPADPGLSQAVILLAAIGDLMFTAAAAVHVAGATTPPNLRTRSGARG